MLSVMNLIETLSPMLPMAHNVADDGVAIVVGRAAGAADHMERVPVE